MCLLVLALPAQGLAAARMMFCVPAQHQTQDPHADHALVAHAHADHGTGHADTSTQAKTNHSKCSACASCSGAMAIVSAPLIFSASPAAPPYVSGALPSYGGHMPDRLDRPPRSTLA